MRRTRFAHIALGASEVSNLEVPTNGSRLTVDNPVCKRDQPAVSGNRYAWTDAIRGLPPLKLIDRRKAVDWVSKEEDGEKGN